MTSIDVKRAALSKENFNGRTAIVTGGSSGIGLSTAKLLHSLGCNVLLGDIRPPESLDELNSGATLKYGISYCECDVTNWVAVCRLFETAITKFGGVDIVHANAGMNDLGDPFFSLNSTLNGQLQEPNLKTIDLNVKGVINTLSVGMHYLKDNTRGGSIILTASLAGYFATVGMPLYSASKHGK
jgi:NAD(P)-dependent dehydrogenase (short-subunit alcohol dehydrogenase family)